MSPTPRSVLVVHLAVELFVGRGAQTFPPGPPVLTEGITCPPAGAPTATTPRYEVGQHTGRWRGLQLPRGHRSWPVAADEVPVGVVVADPAAAEPRGVAGGVEPLPAVAGALNGDRAVVPGLARLSRPVPHPLPGLVQSLLPSGRLRRPRRVCTWPSLPRRVEPGWTGGVDVAAGALDVEPARRPPRQRPRYPGREVRPSEHRQKQCQPTQQESQHPGPHPRQSTPHPPHQPRTDASTAPTAHHHQRRDHQPQRHRDYSGQPAGSAHAHSMNRCPHRL